MKYFITIVFALLTMIVVPSIAYAQHTIPPYHIVERCYTVLFPYPHSRCEYVQVRRHYTPIIPHHHHRHYRPLPHPAHRHWHHQPHHHNWPRR